MKSEHQSKRLVDVARLLVLAGVLIGAVNLIADDVHDEDDRSGAELKRIERVENQKYKEECGGCHLAYPPGLLPERSWRKMMVELDHHFGESAEIEEPGAGEILKFLTENAADHGSRRSRKMASQTPPDETPLRITETSYYKRKHREVAPSIWKRKAVGSPSNCNACHLKAEQGRFSEHEVRIPR